MGDIIQASQRCLDSHYCHNPRSVSGLGPATCKTCHGTRKLDNHDVMGDAATNKGEELLQREWIQDELRLFDTTAVIHHEVGHMVVLRHFGGFGHITLQRQDHLDLFDYRSVSGQFHSGSWPSDPIERAAFGAAGVIAVAMASDPDQDASTICAAVESEDDTFSSTDAELIAGHYWKGAELAFSILQIHWAEFEELVAIELAHWLEVLWQDEVPTECLGPAG